MLKRLILCTLFGHHDWQAVTPPLARAYPMVVCRRCAWTGWQT
jgi:hypothetical protein